MSFLPLILCGLLSASLLAQDTGADSTGKEAGNKEKERIALAGKPDPYTSKDPELMKALGYVAFGPFPWADEHNTEKIESALGLPLLWVETAHFKIGSALPTCAMPAEKEERLKVLEELKRLAKKMPKLKPAALKELDPWLRLHLYAQRCEEFYADMQTRFGVTDKDFEIGTPLTVDEYMGEGPVFGVRGKFLVLIVQKASALGRYGGRFLNREVADSQRWMFPIAGSMLLTMASETSDGQTRGDPALHSHLHFNLTHNMVDAFKGYWYRVPTWIVEGLAHYQERRAYEKYNSFTSLKESDIPLTKEWEWAPKVRARVKHGAFTPFDKVMTWVDPENVSFGEHMMLWSRMDYLQQNHAQAFQKFIKMMKGKIPSKAQVPTTEEIMARQEQALQQCFGFDAKGFDAAWKAWVLAKYPQK